MENRPRFFASRKTYNLNQLKFTVLILKWERVQQNRSRRKRIQKANAVKSLRRNLLRRNLRQRERQLIVGYSRNS
jgi:hypothetical protein